MNNSVNNILNNKKKNISNDSGNPLNYSGVIFFIFLLVAGLLVYTFYNYYASSSLMAGYSYRSKDLDNMENLFESEGITKEECIRQCQNDYLCNGVTYDASLNHCYGTRDGKLRSDDSHLFAWVKDNQVVVQEDDNILVPWTNTQYKVQHRNIPQPVFPGQYAFNFWFRIDDWYHNYTFWRGIMYQGTSIENQLYATSWREVLNKIPKQRMGIWLAPYTNNIRVVIGTNVPYDKKSGEDHPVNQLCKDKSCYVATADRPDRYYYDLEQFDIKDIDIGIHNMMTVIVEEQSIKVYLNGKLVKNIYLDGMPTSTTNDLYIMHNKSYQGVFQYLRYWEKPINAKQIRDLYKDEIFKVSNKEKVEQND